MAIVEIPTLTDGTPHYVMRIQLEGTDYQFSFRFGERRGVWVFDLQTLEGTELIAGQMVTCGRDLLNRVSDPARPPGYLWAMNVSPPKGDPLALPGLYDLGVGGRCRLYYTASTTIDDNTANGILTIADAVAAEK